MQINQFLADVHENFFFLRSNEICHACHILALRMGYWLSLTIYRSVCIAFHMHASEPVRICPSGCLFTYYLSANLLSLCLLLHSIICSLPTCLPERLFTCLYHNLFVYLSSCLFIRPSIDVFIHLIFIRLLIASIFYSPFWPHDLPVRRYIYILLHHCICLWFTHSLIYRLMIVCLPLS